jgi:hypothetical protein
MFTDKVLLTICVNCVVFVFTNKSRPRELCKLLISYLKLNQRFPVFGSNRLYLFMNNEHNFTIETKQEIIKIF